MSENTPNSLANFLEKSYGKKLLDIEVLEYKNKLVQFFSLLIEIDQKSKRKGKENGNKII